MSLYIEIKNDAVLEILRLNFDFILHQLLDFVEPFQCCVHRGNLPLEHDQLIVEPLRALDEDRGWKNIFCEGSGPCRPPTGSSIVNCFEDAP